jgi:prepilin signal peptidase PulO-like enzyme (type II secretory pathway)
MKFLYAWFAAFIGLALGSFVNAFVWRLKHNRNWVSERSECTHCHHVLGFWDLLPVISFVYLRGRCRYCSKKIQDSPWVELLGAVSFGVLVAYWPHGYASLSEKVWLGTWLLSLVWLLALFVYDARWFLLPNKIVYPLLIFALTSATIRAVFLGGGTDLVKQTVLGIAVGGGLFYFLFVVSNERWIGGGDVKLGFLLGALVTSPERAALMLFASSVLGTVVMLPLLAIRKEKTKQIPFGPFLIMGAFFAVLWGDRVINWYLNAMSLV